MSVAFVKTPKSVVVLARCVRDGLYSVQACPFGALTVAQGLAKNETDILSCVCAGPRSGACLSLRAIVSSANYVVFPCNTVGTVSGGKHVFRFRFVLCVAVCGLTRGQ
jgi:hypothetical protein